jgi:hypothetical protein
VKINELLNEDDTLTIKAVTGDDVELSNGTKTKTSAMVPGTDPNTVTMTPTEADALKPGTKVITAPTSEAAGSDNFTPADLKNLEGIRDIDELKSAAIKLISSEGSKHMKPEKIAYFVNRVEQLHSRMNVIKLMYDLLLAGEGHGTIGNKTSMSANSYKKQFGEEYEDDDEESEDDLIASGKNFDISGDPTDDFIDDVVDKKWERSARGHNNNSGQGRSSYAESKELIAMLQIAGLR